MYKLVRKKEYPSIFRIYRVDGLLGGIAIFINSRNKPHELLHYEALNRRVKLTKSEDVKYNNALKGYEGECLYDRIFDRAGHDYLYIYRDLYLQIGNACIQYDTLIITDQGIISNEVKNFTGNYTIENGTWFNNNYQLPNDAFSQLNRSLGKLMDLRNSGQSDFNISGKLVFPNDSFVLRTDDASNWNKIILRSGMREYFRQLNRSSQRLGNKANYISRLVSQSIIENPYFNPSTDKTRLKLGLYCGSCGHFNLNRKRFHLVCNKCGSVESNETHLLRAMSDYKFLFYKEEMTRNDLMAFIDYEISVGIVKRMLKKHCIQKNMGNQSTYMFKYFDFDAALKEPTVKLRYRDHIK